MSDRMTVSVVLPRALQLYASGSDTLLIEPRDATVSAAIAAVGERWPGVVDRVVTEQGELRPHVNVFVGEDNVRFARGLETELTDGATITILAAVSGG